VFHPAYHHLMTESMAAAARSDDHIHVVSSAFPEKEIFSASALKKNPAAPWANYVKGVLDQLRQRGISFGGFDAAIHSSIPMGAGTVAPRRDLNQQNGHGTLKSGAASTATPGSGSKTVDHPVQDATESGHARPGPDQSTPSLPGQIQPYNFDHPVGKPARRETSSSKKRHQP